MDEPRVGPAPQLTKKCVMEALAKMHDGKAAGGSGVVAEMLKCAGEHGFDLITDLFNTIIKENKVPRASFSISTRAKGMLQSGETTEVSSCLNMQ